MNKSDEEYIKIIYRLLGVKGYGRAKANRLLWSLKARSSSPKALEAEIKAMLTAEEQQNFSLQPSLYHSDQPPVSYLSVIDEENYPKDVLQTLQQNAPSVISYMGNLELLHKPRVGFSGSRKVSEKGLWIAKDCAAQLSSKDVCVVSGYANGVDMASHQTALQNGGSTIIVLPEGISHFRIHRELREWWDWKRVLVISEFMPQEKWMAARAMQRNLTIIALSNAMMVIEAGEKGGSLDAGFRTMSYGRTLFVPQYKDVPLSAVGNSLLLKRGARSLMMSAATRHTNVDGVMSSIHHPAGAYAQQSLFG